MEKSRYLNEREVSEATGVALQTLRNWRQQGKGFPYLKIGKLVRYSPEDIKIYFEERKIVPQR